MRRLFMMAAFAAAFSTSAVYGQNRQSLTHYEHTDGTRWLLGCATEEVADNLVEHAGFEYGTGPLAYLCIDGYLPVAKMLND